MSAKPCTQAGCAGTILDGYCDVCGHPEAAVPAPASAGARSTVSGPAGSGAHPAGTAAAAGPTRQTVSSHQLAMMPLGRRWGPATAHLRPRTDGRSGQNRSSRLGAEITTVPPLPPVNAADRIMRFPEVPESRRFCSSCGHPVGRTRDGRPGRTEGYCPQDGTPFSFSPKLSAGTVVAGQYKVAGCLAFGGLGWVYLARDRNVSGRWVVLKGLLDSADPDAVAAAIAEREFLARVEHRLIVAIHNFVTHDGAGYIVMEYVGGTSLMDLLKTRKRDNGGCPDPLPADQAIAYLVEILPALQYLHDEGMVYCDFKPDNVIQVGDSLKLIDLGGVRRIDDLDSPIYGTVGYQAPEVPDVGPSIASDIYTIGRALLALTLDFRGNTTTYATTLPPPEDVALLRRHDSLYRLLLKACAADPADRFTSCDELRTQLLGVLREVVALDRHGDSAADHSAASALFRPPAIEDDVLTWRQLPTVRLDEDDSQLADALSRVPGGTPEQIVDAMARVDKPSVTVQLYQARTAAAAGLTKVVRSACLHVLRADPWQWRAAWLLGLAELQSGSPVHAQEAFNAVYGEVPGEQAPKLALALACELAGNLDHAEPLYLTCLRTDANYAAAAAFGLARVREQHHTKGEAHLDSAVAALDLVPATSRVFVVARRRRAELLLAHADRLEHLAAAHDSLTGVDLDSAVAIRLRGDILRRALDRVLSDGERPGLLVGDVPAQEQPLRSALESAYRQLVPLTDSWTERVRLVDTARAIRRWSWT